MTYLLSLILGMGLISCTCTKQAPERVATPENIVKEFVVLSAAVGSIEDKKKIQNLCSGDLKRTFERMNDEAFQLIYVDSKIKISNFKVIESEPRGDTVRVHYQVSVINNQGTDPTKEINEREVELRKSQGNWAIESIRMKGTDRVAFTRGMIF